MLRIVLDLIDVNPASGPAASSCALNLSKQISQSPAILAEVDKDRVPEKEHVIVVGPVNIEPYKV